MVEVMKSSFIPKKEMKSVGEKSNEGGGGGGLNVFFLISLIVFLSTVIGFTGMYFWRESLVKQNNDSVTAFNDRKEDYGIETFKEFILLNKRIDVGQDLIQKHYAITPIFNFLEKKTIRDIFFTDMILKENGEYVDLDFKGRASNFSDIVLQNMIYTHNPNIENFMFSNITKSKEKRDIIFDMSFSIKKKYLTTDWLFSE